MPSVPGDKMTYDGIVHGVLPGNGVVLALTVCGLSFERRFIDKEEGVVTCLECIAYMRQTSTTLSS